MALYSQIGCPLCHDVIDAVLLLAEKKNCVKTFYSFNFSAYIRYYLKVLIAMNVNISNEHNFSDVKV